jgi:hypothetical protein
MLSLLGALGNRIVILISLIVMPGSNSPGSFGNTVAQVIRLSHLGVPEIACFPLEERMSLGQSSERVSHGGKEGCRKDERMFICQLWRSVLTR